MTTDNIINFPHTDNWGSHIKKFEKSIKDGTLKTKTFFGYTKVDGSNHSIHRFPDGRIIYQGRNAEITNDRDPVDFKSFIAIEAHVEGFKRILETVAQISTKTTSPVTPCAASMSDDDSRSDKSSKDCILGPKRIIIYGEYAGKKIQKASAVSELERFFYIFGIQIITGTSGSNYWFDLEKYRDDIRLPTSYRIFNKADFPKYSITIDYQDLVASEKNLTAITDLVNKECPVAKYIAHLDGVTLKKTTGEGIVWSAETKDAGVAFSSSFKTKGPEFMPRNDVKSSATSTSTSSAPISNVNEEVERFAYANVTDVRCKQGLHYLKENGLELEKSSMNAFATWVTDDITREEADYSDLVAKSSYYKENSCCTYETLHILVRQLPEARQIY